MWFLILRTRGAASPDGFAQALLKSSKRDPDGDDTVQHYFLINRNDPRKIESVIDSPFDVWYLACGFKSQCQRQQAARKRITAKAARRGARA